MKHRVIRGVVLTSALTGSCVSMPSALAQTANDAAPATQGLEQVVVTGIRGSLESARNFKRNASQIVDAIVAEDIGKLPDRNVAESLARVSGVQVDRGIGEGTSISVRGLRQNVTLFNGREIVDSTGRGGTGLDQLGTSTYGILALVPSELISQLEVTKLAGADQISGGLGGIVDIRTRMPLDGPKSQFALKVGASRDQLPGKSGGEIFGLASGKFNNDTLGLLLSVSADKRGMAQQGLDTFSGYRSFTEASNPTRLRFGNQDARIQDLQEDRNKSGFNAAVQWRPSPGFEVSADTFVSKMTSKRDRYWLSFNPTSGLANANYSANDILLSGSATGAVLTNTEAADVDSDIASTAVRGKFAVTDSLKGFVEASSGKATSSYRQMYFRLQPLANITPTVNFDFTKSDFGSYSVTGLDLLNPNSLRHTILFENLYRAASDNTTWRADFTQSLDIPIAESVEFGGRINRLNSRQNPLRADLRPAGGIPANQLGSFLTTYSNPSFAPDALAGQSSYLVAARSAITGCAAFTAFPAISQNIQCLNPEATTNAVAGTFEVREEFTDAYAKVNLESAVGSANVTGNAGVRLLRRQMDSIGNLIGADGKATPTTFQRSDSEVLPSAVAKIGVAKDLFVRVGAAKVVAFPNTADLNNGVSLSNNAIFTNGVQTQPGTGSGGAPGLEPFRATQLDLSVEKYFGKQAMASLGLFNKDISSFIIQKQSAESYGGINYLINRKVNGEGATVRGAEVLVQLPFYFLPQPWDAFGVMTTYSYIDSQTPIRDVSGRQLPFPGLSKNNVNLVAYYESGPIGVRLAYNWRDAYLLSLSAAGTGVYNDAYTDLSATLRYEFSPAASFNFEAANLLNSQQRTYDGATEGLRTNNIFGRVLRASVSLKF
ncbi:MAG: TonB-dependent receptor [Rhodoferax sp.]|nr:TonB-dependent receptor [Rhodoferax sp.]